MAVLISYSQIAAGIQDRKHLRERITVHLLYQPVVCFSQFLVVVVLL